MSSTKAAPATTNAESPKPQTAAKTTRVHTRTAAVPGGESPKRRRVNTAPMHFSSMDEQLNKLSTRAHRITHDIYFSQGAGRKTTFDPFQTKDLTVLSSDKVDPSRTLTYFPKEQVRKQPMLVDMARQPPGHTLDLSQPVSTQATYDVVLPPTVKDVSFGKAPRFSDSSANRPLRAASSSGTTAKTVEAPVDVAPNVATLLLNIDRALNRAAMGKPSVDVKFGRDLSTPLQRKVPDVSPSDTTEVKSTVLDTSHAPSFGRMSNRSGRAPSASGPPTLKQLQEEHKAKHPRRGYVVFPWEEKPKQAAGAEGDGRSPGVTTPRDNDPRDEEVVAAEWQERRRALIARFGLSGEMSANRYGGSRITTPYGEGVAPNIRKTTDRTNPVFFAERPKELHDVSYAPNYSATTQDRNVPSTNIGGFASRESKKHDGHLKNIDRALQPSALSRLHQKVEAAKRKDFLSRTDGSSAHLYQAVQQGGREGLPSTMAGAARTNLTQADDLTCGRESLYPPARSFTRQFKGSPDFGLYGGRSDEPIASIAGTDPARRRAASAGLY